MTTIGISCQKCACPLPEASHLICGQCIKNPPHFDKAIIEYTFEEPLRGLLHHFKYHKGLWLNSFLSHLMFKAIQKHPTQAQCLIPVPLHPLKIKQRGFNHAALLTRSLAKKLNLPYDLYSCQKIINTVPQASLDREQRQKNLHKAFRTSPISYQHVILIDDLLTTGSTANELALSLKKTGVQRVDIWCCARAV